MKKKKITKELLYLCVTDEEGNGLIFKTLRQLKPYTIVKLNGLDEDGDYYKGDFVVSEDWKQGMNICIRAEKWKEYLNSL